MVVHGVFDTTHSLVQEESRKSHVEDEAAEGVATTQPQRECRIRAPHKLSKIIIKAGCQETEDVRAAHARTCDPTCVMHPRAHGLSWGRQLVC